MGILFPCSYYHFEVSSKQFPVTSAEIERMETHPNHVLCLPVTHIKEEEWFCFEKNDKNFYFSLRLPLLGCTFYSRRFVLPSSNIRRRSESALKYAEKMEEWSSKLLLKNLYFFRRCQFIRK